ncbi:MAG: amino acid permease [Myxococcales bacterium]|nr:amino acid permease [Myxococcales bacterium]
MDTNDGESRRDADAEALGRLGYAQELSRRMGGFSNFALSFSIICILAGGITAFPGGLGAGGGASIGIGWPVGALFAGVVALAMAQIASAFPTAGGLYHWSSTLGGRGYGWVTAWFNLLGLIFVTAAINFGVWDPMFKTLIAPLLNLDPAKLTWAHQTAFIAGVTALQAWLNDRAVGLTGRLTDLSGYLIFVVTFVLIGALLFAAPGPLEFERLVTFTNFTGAEGSWWPRSESGISVFLSGLLLTIYTLTGYDASAHASEETRDASRNVPRGILRAVLWSSIFGYLLIATFLLTLPDLPTAVAQGLGFFESLLAQLPRGVAIGLGIGIFAVNFLCGLAALTSTSRMTYAFARDGGLPFSEQLRSVDPVRKSPGVAIWTAATLAFAATVYGDAFVVLSTGSAVFLYISYIMPSVAGLYAEGRTWKRKGAFDLGLASRPISALATIGGAVLVYVGIQPPNEKVLYLALGLGALLALFWFVFGERKRFVGPPKASED